MLDSFPPNHNNTFDPFLTKSGLNLDPTDSIFSQQSNIIPNTISAFSQEVINFDPSAVSDNGSLTPLHLLSTTQSTEDLRAGQSSVDALTGETLSNSNDGNLPIAPIVEQAVRSAQGYLSGLATDPDFNAKMNLVFGNSWNTDVANTLVKAFAKGDFSQLPSIEILRSAAINGANGAFASVTNTIYLANDFVEQNAGNLGAITSVVLEETGHYIDSKVNVSDAAGDEGDIFARVVEGKAISADELRDLKNEDDRANIKLGGKDISIEMSQIAMASLNGRIYQSHRGLYNDNIYTRSSTDGVNWTPWNTNYDGNTPSAPTLAVLNGKLYQSHRGFNNQIYTRSSTDGVKWSNWYESSGWQTTSAPTLESFNGKLYQSIRGLDNRIYTRSSTDGINWIGGWNSNYDGDTPSTPTLAVLNGKLYQSHRGFNNQIYTRSSTDGAKWSNWYESSGWQTTSTPTLESFNGKLYQSIRGLDNKIYTRSSTDGINWIGGWNSNYDGDTPTALSLVALNGRLYQSHQGVNNNIYTRYSTDGVNWTRWNNNGGGETPTDLDDSPNWGTITGKNALGQTLSHPVSIQRVDESGRRSSQSIELGKTTWLVIHGWKGNPSDGEIPGLAGAIDRADDQVLTLDWSSAAASYIDTDVAKAASWIPKVADWAAQKLRDWGFTNGYNLNLNLVGHSLGSYVAGEIAKRISGGVNRIVALDPAKEFSGGYDTSSIDFSANSQFSWGFYGSAAGSYQRAATADESWSIGFGRNDFWENHGRVVNVFASMVEQARTNPNHNISKFFGLGQMSQNISKIWRPNVFNDLGKNQSGYRQFEGRLESREQNGRWVPTKLIYADKITGVIDPILA